MTIQENNYYAYRVTNIDGSQSSDPCYIPMPLPIPLFAPTNLTATTLGQGIQLNWQNVSAVTTSITVMRGTGQQTPSTVLATLGPQSQSFIDSTAGFGYYSYAVNITDGTGIATSASVLASAPNPQGATSFTPTVLGGQLGWAGAAMRPDGTWALAVNYSPLGIQATQGLWPQWISTGAVNSSRNLIQINSQGWPELLYFDYDSQNPGKATLDQVVFDGTTWAKNQLAGSLLTSYAAPPDCVWRLDANGGVHALVTTYDTSTNYKVPTASYLHATTSGVDLIPMTTLLPSLPVPINSQLFVDSGNAPHLVVTVPGELDECWPAIDGTWAKTTIFSGPGVNEIQQFIPLSTGADSAWVLATSAVSAWGSPATMQAFHKVGGVWQPSRQIYSMPSPSYPVCTGMAQSPDGSRAAALITDSGVGLVVLIYSGTTWVPTLVAPPQTSGMGIGFDASGRLHVLGYDSVAMQLVEYHE
jgi:hypothetical protein